MTTCRVVLAGAGRRRRSGRAAGPAARTRRHWPGLLVVAAGVVIGFPLLTTLALQTSTTSHAAVVVGPAAADHGRLLLAAHRGAALAPLSGRRRSPGRRWSVAFALQQSGGAPTLGDLYLFGALLICAAGYAEGGRLARALPGWQVIGWALVAACRSVAGPARRRAVRRAGTLDGARRGRAGCGWRWGRSSWAWWSGTAAWRAIGVARASQLQLAQPLLTLVWSVLLLGEHLGPAAPSPPSRSWCASG